MMEALQDPDSNENCVSFNGLSLKDLMRAFNFIFDDAHKDDEEKKHVHQCTCAGNSSTLRSLVVAWRYFGQKKTRIFQA